MRRRRDELAVLDHEDLAVTAREDVLLHAVGPPAVVEDGEPLMVELPDLVAPLPGAGVVVAHGGKLSGNGEGGQGRGRDASALAVAAEKVYVIKNVQLNPLG